MKQCDYDHKVKILLQTVGCTQLREIYPDKISDFLGVVIEEYKENTLSLIDFATICEQLLQTIPIHKWENYEELELVLKIADLTWYLKQRNKYTLIIKQTMDELSLFSKHSIFLD